METKERDKIRAKEKKVSKKLLDMAAEIKKELRYVGSTTSTITNKVSVSVLWIDWMMTSFKGNLATVIALLDALEAAEKDIASKQLTLDIFRIERDMHNAENKKLEDFKGIAELTYPKECIIINGSVEIIEKARTQTSKALTQKGKQE